VAQTGTAARPGRGGIQAAIWQEQRRRLPRQQGGRDPVILALVLVPIYCIVLTSLSTQGR